MLIDFKKPALWKDYLLAAFSGLLLMLSWHNIFNPDIAAWPGYLAFVAFIPYICVWRRTGWRGNFIFSWLMGFIYFLGILFWVRLISQDTNIDNNIAWLIFAFLGGIYFGLFGATTSVIRSRLQWPIALVLPLGWVAWEYIRGHFITGGWPWGSFGHTQYANPVTRQLAAVAGVGGISCFLFTFNIFLLYLSEKLIKIIKKEKKNKETLQKLKENIILYKKNHPFMSMVVILFILLWSSILIIDVWEIIQFRKAKTVDMKIALIQGDINTDQVWNKEYRIKVMTKMTKLHQQAVAQKPHMIVWAESSFPGILDYTPSYQWEAQLRALIKAGDIPTLLTSNEYEKTHQISGQKYRHFNSAFLLGRQGQTLGRYRKIKLVPGGEYIPWNWMKSFMRSVVQEPIPQDFEPGTDYSPIKLGPLRVSPLICYEDHFEELGYQLAKRGTHFFVDMANNGWSQETTMGLQHTTMSVFLAVEHRASIAKADMTGPTCTIDGWGNMTEPLPYYEPGVKIETIKIANFKTFFSRYGNIIPLLFTILFFMLLTLQFFWSIRDKK